MECDLLRIQKLLGKKWTIMILQELSWNNILSFNQIRKRIKQVTNKILAQRLGELEEEELVQRKVINKRPRRVEYALTEKGKDMVKMWDLMKKWGIKNVLVHQDCLETNCSECKLRK